MNFPPDIQRALTRSACVLALPSWGGFLYALLARPHQISFPVHASLPEMGFITVATLICSLLACLCAAPSLDDDYTSLSGWVFFLACSVPFFGMLCLLNPAGIGPRFH